MNSDPLVLDNEQKKAVFAPTDQSIIVLSPPGCGKTLLMAKRIEYLVRIGAVLPPFRILGLTFTNAAANEMKDRVTREIPETEGIVYITNFHSFAYSVLRAYGNIVGIPRRFTVLGEIEKDEFLLRVFSRYEITIKEIMNLHPEDRFRQLRDNEIWNRYKDWNMESLLKINEEYCDGDYDELFQEVLINFQKELIKSAFLDFDHILWFAYRLLRENSNLLDYYRAAFKYVLVDEFQDTNSLQFKILSLLTSDNEITSKYIPANVFILADPDQAIYEFQGATPENIEIAKKLYKCVEIELYKDYRFFSEGIKFLKSAISFYMRNGHIDDVSKKTAYDRPSFIAFANRHEEAQYILDRVKSFLTDDILLHEIAVLSFDQYRISDVKKSLDQEDIANIFVPDFRRGNIERNYRKLFKSLGNTLKKKSFGHLHSIFEEICKKENFDLDSDEVLKELWKISRGYDRVQFRSKTLWEKNQLFINEILLEINWGEVLRERVKNKIFLSTIHGVKGLQFEIIIICGLEQYSFPNWRVCNLCQRNSENIDYFKKELQKNLKILYVGVSRAKSHLYLTSSLNGIYGIYRPVTCLLEPFTDFLDISQNIGDFCSKLII